MHLNTTSHTFRAASVLGLSATLSLLTSCGNPTPEVKIQMSDFSFEPNGFTISRSTKTIVKLDNTGSVDHQLKVARLNITSPVVAPGKSATVEIIAPSGPLQFACAFHEAQGMVGQITVSLTKA